MVQVQQSGERDSSALFIQVSAAASDNLIF